MGKKQVCLKAKSLAENIERNAHILSTSADHAARKIFLFGDVDDHSAFRLVSALAVMDNEEDPITIYMNTPGGDVESGYAIYDAIRFCKSHVTIVGIGSVMSMGSIIMQAADTRLMTPMAKMMIHTGSASFGGEVDSDKLISIGQETIRCRAMFAKILAERSGLKLKAVEEMLIRESYMTAQEALEVGFIDGILTEQIKTVAPVEKIAPAKKTKTKKTT